MTKDTKKQRVQIFLPQDIIARILKKSKQNDSSFSRVAGRLIKNGLECIQQARGMIRVFFFENSKEKAVTGEFIDEDDLYLYVRTDEGEEVTIPKNKIISIKR